MELLIVVLIIGILASIGLPNYSKSVEMSKARDCQGSLAMLYSAARSCQLDNNDTPTKCTLSYLTLNNYLGSISTDDFNWTVYGTIYVQATRNKGTYQNQYYRVYIQQYGSYAAGQCIVSSLFPACKI